MIISFVAYEKSMHELNNLLTFSDETFFYVCLPPIVFGSGFNMQRGNFFANIKNILMFGVITTFLCFFVFSSLTIYIKNLGFLKQYDGATGTWSELNLLSTECLLMCSLLCSSDVIAAISLINYEK